MLSSWSREISSPDFLLCFFFFFFLTRSSLGVGTSSSSSLLLSCFFFFFFTLVCSSVSRVSATEFSLSGFLWSTKTLSSLHLSFFFFFSFGSPNSTLPLYGLFNSTFNFFAVSASSNS